MLESLEKEQKLDIITTNRKLAELRSFFQLVRQNKFDEGLERVARLSLIPLKQDDINEKVSKYTDLDPILKAQFPALLSGTMHCLYGLHRDVKSESRNITPTVEGRLKDLQFMSRFIYIFAGLVSMPGSTKEDIQRMRNHMI